MSDEEKHVISGIERALAVSSEERHCWVCFATEEDDPGSSWVRPCHCKGTSKWVHQKCLQRWVDEKQRGNPVGKVACPQCNITYIIVYPDMGPIVVILDSINTVICKVCPFLAAGVMVGALYWVAVTYGAVTIMQIMGQEEGQEFLEMSDPLFLLISLPVIPATLIFGKMIQWEDSVLTFMRRQAAQLPMLKYIFPSFANSDSSLDEPNPPPQSRDPASATRVLCTALVFPTMASIFGGIFFRSVKSNVQRAALGAIAFLVCNGALKLYHKQKIYTRQRQRKILDWDLDEANLQSIQGLVNSTNGRENML